MLPSERILARLYGGKLKKKKRRRVGVDRVVGWLRDNVWNLAIGFGLFVAWVLGHLYYYNKLIDMEYNIQEAWAQVESEQQRRFHIQQSVTRVVLAYARHEEQVLTQLTRLRTGGEGVVADEARRRPGVSAKQPTFGRRSAKQPPAAGTTTEIVERLKSGKVGPKELNKLFPQIQFMAEQYPKLRLTENFQQFSTAMIDTETKIAEHIQEYNRRVNSYTTVLRQFPGNIFGRVCGFEPYNYYSPDKSKLMFRPVAMGG